MTKILAWMRFMEVTQDDVDLSYLMEEIQVPQDKVAAGNLQQKQNQSVLMKTENVNNTMQPSRKRSKTDTDLLRKVTA